MLNHVLDGLEGSQLSTAKWMALAPCSPDTALRDINGLLALGVLEKLAGGGGDTAYAVRFSAP